jgi:hypothetical protein
MFVYHLSIHRQSNGTPIMAVTINGYITHVVFYLIDLGIIDSASEFRCPATSRLVQAITLQDARRLGPLRLRINIAVTLPIIQMAMQVALTLFPCEVTRSYIRAALYIGLAFSLRPDDFLRPDSGSDHKVCAMQFAFWFPTQYVLLCDTQQFPPYPVRPTRMSLLPDYDKANREGQAVMRACAGNPNLTEPCFIQYLFEFFRRYPPLSPSSALFSALPPHIDLYMCINSLLKHTAPLLGLNPNQLLPKGLRAAATAHIRTFGGTDADAKLTGGWRSDAHDVYKRANFAASDRCALAMHSLQADDLTLLSYIHSAPAPSR